MIKLEIPQPLVQGWKMNMVGWVDAQKKSRSKFQLKLLIYDTTIFVEGIESLHIPEGSNPSAFQRSKHQCDLAELPGFLLYQVWVFISHAEDNLEMQCFYIKLS
jgi:hypothetical protein